MTKKKLDDSFVHEDVHEYVCEDVNAYTDAGVDIVDFAYVYKYVHEHMHAHAHTDMNLKDNKS